jgi:hypothetical protein
LVLSGAGWLVTAIGVVFSIANPVVQLTKSGSISLAAIVGLLGGISAAVLFGRLLVVAASVGQSDSEMHRLYPRARLLRIVGLLLCVSWPCFVVGRMLTHLEVMRQLGAEGFFHLSYPDYLKLGLPPIILGIVGVGCAEKWGRRRPPLDVSDVFS